MALKKSNELGVAIKAARQSGKILMENYGRVAVEYKADNSPVTKADRASEKNIRRILGENFPGYSILGEEYGMEKRENEEFLWVVDPLDGTTNYLMQNPFFNVSIALVKNSVPVLGVVYYPFQKEIFYAQRDRGAYLNDKRIVVSKKDKIEKSILTFCHGSGEMQIRLIVGIFEQFRLRASSVRQIGAAALELAYVASGRVESFLMISQNPWDVAAGALLVEEAGGKTTDFDGGEFNIKSSDLLASNGKIHEELLEIIKDCKNEGV